MSPDDDTTPGAPGERRPPAVAEGEFRFSPRPNRAHEIGWRPWGAAAFAAAREGRRPVLLSISAVWCHWCHVMDETTYSDPGVIDFINENFIAVRVDNDRRPDVNRRFNMGGWPTTAFLAADGQVITGATYLPAAQMHNALEAVAGFYAEHEMESLARPPGPRQVRIDAGRDAAGSASRLTADTVANIVREVARLYDPLHGGLGTEPKFPQTEALSLLLIWGWRHADERVRDMALASLRAMAEGGVYDHVEGGFFRYATRRDWSEPHYEKMLEDNARLALLYLDAHAATGERRYAEVAAGVTAFITGVLRLDGTPLFAGSQDADEVYFRLPAKGRERSDVVPPIDATAYAEWNALAARALLRAARALERPELEELGLATLDHLWDHGFGRHGMLRCLAPTPGEAAAGDAGVGGLIGDQAVMLAALLDAHEATGERLYVARAEVLADWILAHLRGEDGRLLDRPASTADGPEANSRPVPVIDAGAEIAAGLLRLAAAAGRRDYGEAAAQTLAAWADDHQGYGSFAAPYALALMRLLDHPPHVALVGRRDDERTRALRRAALSQAVPLLTVASFDPAHDTEVMAREGHLESDLPAAYVCAGGVCSAPVTDPGALAAALRDLGPASHDETRPAAVRTRADGDSFPDRHER